MALLRYVAAIATGVMLAASPVLADEIQDITQQYRKGELPAALDHANQYLAKDPRNAQARFLKGLILGDQGKTSEAIEVLKGLTEDYPELAEPYNNLGVLYAAQGKYDDARTALEMAIRANPNYATAQENLGDIYAKMAVLAYGKVVALDNTNASARSKATLIQNMLGGQAGNPADVQAAPAK